MRQDINFYRYTPPTPLEQLLALPVVVSIAALLAVLVLLAQAWAWQLRHDDQRRLSTSQKTEQQATAEADQLAKQLEAQSVPPEPAAATAQADSTQLLATLKALPAQHRGFADRLLALAQAHVPSLWLQRIELGNGARPALALTGQAKEPAPLADYTVRLGSQPALRATTLYQLSGQAEADQSGMSFTLSNRPVAAPAATEATP